MAAEEATVVPQTMKRLVVQSPGPSVRECQIEVQSDVAVPVPGPGQVLIRVVAAAINPSDYEAWIHCRPEQCPYAMGKEGSGIIVRMGEGLLMTLTSKLSLLYVGRKVAFAALPQQQGAYSEYVVADATSTFPLPDDVPVEEAAAFYVNPFTAVGILETVKAEGSTAFVHTAAASQLGQMLVKLAPSENIDIINVVRRQEQAELLQNLGAKHIVVMASDNDSWKQELDAKIKELNVSIAFDAVAGATTGHLMDIMPPGGTVYVYGKLAGSIQNVEPINLIYHGKKLKGFVVTKDFLQKGGMLAMATRVWMVGQKVISGIKDNGWSSSQFLDTTLENTQADLVQWLDSGITGKKLRVRFQT
jgi:NADPH:quinone reductase-like Zn-dependent oxidoreductase